MKRINFIDEYMEKHDKAILEAAGYDSKTDATFVRCYIESIEHKTFDLTICNMNNLPDDAKDASNFIDACKKYGVKKFCISTHSTDDVAAATRFSLQGAKLLDATLIDYTEPFEEKTTFKTALVFAI